MVNAKADGKDAQGNTTYVVDTDNKKQPSITWTTDNNVSLLKLLQMQASRRVMILGQLV